MTSSICFSQRVLQILIEVTHSIRLCIGDPHLCRLNITRDCAGLDPEVDIIQFWVSGVSVKLAFPTHKVIPRHMSGNMSIGLPERVITVESARTGLMSGGIVILQRIESGIGITI